MKHLAILFALIAISTIVLGQIDTTDFQQTDAEWAGFEDFNFKTKKYPKRIRKQMEDVLLIDGGSFTRTNPLHYHLLEKDSSVVSDYSDLIEELCPPKHFNLLDMDSSVVSDSSDSIEQLYRTKFYFPLRFSDTRLTVASFLLSDHEVTNKEYREFVDWVTASVARKILAEKYPEKYLMKSNISPTDKVFRPNVPIDWQDDYLRSILFSDTNRCGEKKINKSKIRYFGEIQVLDTLIHFDSLVIYPQTDDISYYLGMDQYSSCRNYFEDPTWDDYPVVGVSWEQAMAYCSWKTNRVNESILLWQKIINHPFYRDDNLWTESVDWTKLEENVRIPSYRLPTKAEWEYAALAIDNVTNPIRGWDNKRSSRDRINLTDQDGSYLYNFGEIYDENGVIIKYFDSDGAIFSNKVKSYPSNALGLYDMVGNVSEWVLDGFNEEKLCIKDLESTMDLDDRVDKILTYIREENFELEPFRADKDLFYAQKYAKASMRFTQNFENKENLKLVRGGSWADGPMYLDPELDSAYPAQTQSMKIGFRIAQDVIGSPGMGGRKR